MGFRPAVRQNGGKFRVVWALRVLEVLCSPVRRCLLHHAMFAYDSRSEDDTGLINNIARWWKEETGEAEWVEDIYRRESKTWYPIHGGQLREPALRKPTAKSQLHGDQFSQPHGRAACMRLQGELTFVAAPTARDRPGSREKKKGVGCAASLAKV